LKHLQLVPQRQHFELQDGTPARATSKGQQKREDDRHDGRESYVLVASKINGINGNGLFDRHRRRLSKRRRDVMCSFCHSSDRRSRRRQRAEVEMGDRKGTQGVYNGDRRGTPILGLMQAGGAAEAAQQRESDRVTSPRRKQHTDEVLRAARQMCQAPSREPFARFPPPLTFGITKLPRCAESCRTRHCIRGQMR
jgi:hypothetical protein